MYIGDMTNKEQNIRIWHTNDERPADGSQVLIIDHNGLGTAGDYDADDDSLAADAGGLCDDWKDWHVERWAYIGELTGENEALRRAMEKEIEHMELHHSASWNFEQAMMQASRGLANSTKAAYMITLWWQMLHMSVSDAKDWLARFGDAASDDNASARSMLENYISLTAEHLARLDGVTKEYRERKRREMGLSNDEQEG